MALWRQRSPPPLYLSFTLTHTRTCCINESSTHQINGLFVGCSRRGGGGCGWVAMFALFPTLALFSAGIFAPKTFDAAILQTKRVYANLSLLCRTGFPLAGLFSQHSRERKRGGGKQQKWRPPGVFSAQQSISHRHNGAPVVNQWILVPLAIICSRFVSEAGGRHAAHKGTWASVSSLFSTEKTSNVQYQMTRTVCFLLEKQQKSFAVESIGHLFCH